MAPPTGKVGYVCEKERWKGRAGRNRFWLGSEEAKEPPVCRQRLGNSDSDGLGPQGLLCSFINHGMGTVTFSDPELTPRALGQLYLVLLLVLLRLKCYFEAEFLDVP